MEAEPTTYTLDELSEITEIPQRTIRFYQAEKLLRKPDRDRTDGRVARYSHDHVERLQLIADLQDRGLKIPAIRELVNSSDATEKVADWLGLDESLRGSWNAATPLLMSRKDLRQRVSDLPKGTLGRLESGGLIAEQGDSWIIRNPDLFELTLGLVADGIEIDLVLRSGEILTTQLRKAAEQLIDLFVDAIGEGFGADSTVERLVNTLRPITGDAAGMIFAAELERSVAALLSDTRRLKKLER